MMNIIKVILFVIVNVAGFYTLPVLGNLAIKMDMLPNLPVGPHMELFKWWFMGVGMWVFLASVIVSAGYFFARDELKNWLLFAPMYITGFFGVGVLIYFNVFYTGA